MEKFEVNSCGVLVFFFLNFCCMFLGIFKFVFVLFATKWILKNDDELMLTIF